jgi:5-formyltetrahydrofolate cyclo-ligase
VKLDLRREARARRVDLGEQGRRAGSETISRHILSLAASIRSPSAGFIVTGFVSTKSEVAIDAAMRALLDGDVIVGIPRVVDVGAGIMEMDRLETTDELDRLVPGPHDIPQRPEAKWLDPTTIDVVFVPLLAFDRLGTRLGAGAGYYDRYLARLRPADQQYGPKLRTVSSKFVGIGFAAQEFVSLPHEPHDIRLDGVITEDGLRWF